MPGSSQVVVGDKGRTCVYGILQQCLKNEECVTSGQRRRTGTCHCRQGFARDPATGACVAAPPNTTPGDGQVGVATGLSGHSVDWHVLPRQYIEVRTVEQVEQVGTSMHSRNKLREFVFKFGMERASFGT